MDPDDVDAAMQKDAAERHAREQFERAAKAGCHESDELDRREAEDLFGDADEEGFDEASPERVTDDELFDERDFETLQEYVDDDGNKKFWEVEESYDVEEEEAAPKKIQESPLNRSGKITESIIYLTEAGAHIVRKEEEPAYNIEESRRKERFRYLGSITYWAHMTPRAMLMSR